jgi:integrase
MEAMPRQKPKYLHIDRSRHGQLRQYVRRPNDGKNIRIRAEFGSPQFWAEYDAALNGTTAAKQGRGPSRDSVGWLIARYRETTEWADLAPATRKQRDNIFGRTIIPAIGDKPYRQWTTAGIDKSLKDRRSTPSKARHILQTIRPMFAWAVKAKLLRANPTDGLTVKLPKTDGFPVWDEDDLKRLEDYWKIGTRERLLFAIYAYTGLRKGDVAVFGRSHIRTGAIVIKTEKTGTEVELPLSPMFKSILDATPIKGVTFVTRLDGGPYTKESLGNWFREICDKAGCTGSAHGIRKAVATRYANAGVSEAQLCCAMGWEIGSRVAATYIKKANRVRLAAQAMAALDEARTKEAHPDNTVRIFGQKA